MTYNVFGGTLSLTQSINHYTVIVTWITATWVAPQRVGEFHNARRVVTICVFGSIDSFAIE